MPETVILCGDAQRPKRAKKVLSLAVSGVNQNVRLESEDVGRRMLASLPATLADLLDVATYVYAADQMVSRGGATAHRLGSDWRRELRFIIPVREPERWASPEISSSLEQLLGFMSEDTIRFEFGQARDPPRTSDYFEFGGDIEEVLLFSGGLDSLSGAVDRLINGHARLLLVSHVSSTKMGSRQRELARELAQRFPKRVVHIPVRIRMHGLEPVERTQRTRSFLFGALAGAVARLSGTSSFSLFENGVVLQPAYRQPSRWCRRYTYHSSAGYSGSFHIPFGSPQHRFVRAEPLYLEDKSEVAEGLSQTDHADLARRTISCSSVYSRTRLHTHCGRCSQCLDRRFGALAGGLGKNDPEEMYEVDLLTGSREDGPDRVMAKSFVRHALELRDVSQRSFISRFAGELARAVTCFPGMSAAKAAVAMLNLHSRHAAAVHSVLEEGYRNYARDLAAQTLPSTCILRLVAGSEGIIAPSRTEPPSPYPTSVIDARDYGRSSQLRLALEHQGQRVLIEGIPPLEGRSTFAVIQFLVEVASKDRNKGRAPESHAFIPTYTLCEAVKMGEASLRRCIYRIRTRLAEAFEANAGLSLPDHALIENAPWKSYRLNPAVLILAAEAVAPRAKVTVPST